MDLETGVELVGYADDLAVMVSGKTSEIIKDKAEYSIVQISKMLKEKGLQLTEQKTEVVILEGRRRLTNIEITVGKNTIKSSDSDKYLGVWMDRNMLMTTHIRRTVEKAGKMHGALSRIMPRKGGPAHARRNLLATVIRSVVLYAAPAWEVALKHKRYVAMLRSVERKAAISVTSAYRTVSTEAVGVLARHPPMDLLARERARNWEGGGEKGKENRENVMEGWQERWDQYRGWAKVFVKDIRSWLKAEFEMDYYTTQAITGHGIFGTT